MRHCVRLREMSFMGIVTSQMCAEVTNQVYGKRYYERKAERTCSSGMR